MMTIGNCFGRIEMKDYTVKVLHGNISQKEAEQIVKDALDGNIEVTNRYGSLENMPDPDTICLGQCEGMGCIPVRHSTNDPELRRIWEEAEKKNQSDDGYHFVTCPTCNGTGLRES